MSANEIVDHVQYLFKESLCPGQLELQPSGYFNQCVVNTYMVALPQVVILAILLRGLVNLGPGGLVRTRLKNVNMVLTILHVVVMVRYGPEVFNVLTMTMNLALLFLVFVSSYADLNGFRVPNRAIEYYYYLLTGATGYLMLSLFSEHVDVAHDERLSASALICVVALLNSGARNIAAAVPDEKPKSE